MICFCIFGKNFKSLPFFMIIKAFPFNPFQENTYIIHDETKACIIIDPGCYTHQEKRMIGLN